MFNLFILNQLGAFAVHDVDVDSNAFFRFTLLRHLFQILDQRADEGIFLAVHSDADTQGRRTLLFFDPGEEDREKGEQDQNDGANYQ